MSLILIKEIYKQDLFTFPKVCTWERPQSYRSEDKHRRFKRGIHVHISGSIARFKIPCHTTQLSPPSQATSSKPSWSTLSWTNHSPDQKTHSFYLILTCTWYCILHPTHRRAQLCISNLCPPKKSKSKFRYLHIVQAFHRQLTISGVILSSWPVKSGDPSPQSHSTCICQGIEGKISWNTTCLWKNENTSSETPCVIKRKEIHPIHLLTSAFVGRTELFE